MKKGIDSLNNNKLTYTAQYTGIDLNDITATEIGFVDSTYYIKI